MYYTDIDHFITERYHIVLEGWPLEKFCSPSDIQSRNKISVLMKSLDSGATRFRKLSTTEFEDWRSLLSSTDSWGIPRIPGIFGILKILKNEIWLGNHLKSHSHSCGIHMGMNSHEIIPEILGTE